MSHHKTRREGALTFYFPNADRKPRTGAVLLDAPVGHFKEGPWISVVPPEEIIRSDTRIQNWAYQNRLVVITADKGFVTDHPRTPHCGVLVLDQQLAVSIDKFELAYTKFRVSLARDGVVLPEFSPAGNQVQAEVEQAGTTPKGASFPLRAGFKPASELSSPPVSGKLVYPKTALSHEHGQVLTKQTVKTYSASDGQLVQLVRCLHELCRMKWLAPTPLLQNPKRLRCWCGSRVGICNRWVALAGKSR